MYYDYLTYWQDKGQEPAAALSNDLINQIRKILKEYEFYTVFELGCGDGQLSRILKELNCMITGLDLSEDRLQMNNDIDIKLLSDFTKDDLNILKSDLVICCNFLLHIKPKHIKFVLDKMIEYSSKYIIFIEPNPKTNLGTWEYYNFNHDYYDLIKNLDYKIIPLSNYTNCYIITK